MTAINATPGTSPLRILGLTLLKEIVGVSAAGRHIPHAYDGGKVTSEREETALLCIKTRWHLSLGQCSIHTLNKQALNETESPCQNALSRIKVISDEFCIYS